MTINPRWIAAGPQGEIIFSGQYDTVNPNYYSAPHTVSFVLLVRLKQGSRRKRLKFFRREIKKKLTSVKSMQQSMVEYMHDTTK